MFYYLNFYFHQYCSHNLFSLVWKKDCFIFHALIIINHWLIFESFDAFQGSSPFLVLVSGKINKFWFSQVVANGTRSLPMVNNQSCFNFSQIMQYILLWCNFFQLALVNLLQFICGKFGSFTRLSNQMIRNCSLLAIHALPLLNATFWAAATASATTSASATSSASAN